MRKRILFGTSSWGLGHATRDLVLMRALLAEGCDLTVVSSGGALDVLRRELAPSCSYLDWEDIPTSVATTGWGFYAKTVANIPQILQTWFAEKRRLRQLLSQQAFDAIVSDHRYGLVTSAVPCYFLTHSPRYIAPWRDPFMEAAMEGFISRWLAPVTRVLIPDDEEGGLSGDMSHKLRFFPADKRVYLGILSSLRRRQLPRDVDVFISLSGPEPQRTKLEELVIGQLRELEGLRVVLALGKPGGSARTCPDHVEVYPYLDRSGQEEIMNRSRLVICRSGYTTLMELAEIGQRALLTPTPGQSEQVYLAKTLKKRGLFYSVKQGELDLARDMPRARKYPGYRPRRTTEASVQRFLETVLNR